MLANNFLCSTFKNFLKTILEIFYFHYLDKTYIWLVNLTKPGYTNFTIPLSHFSFKALKDFCNLYACGKFAHKKWDLQKIVSKPYLTVFLTLFDRI